MCDLIRVVVLLIERACGGLHLNLRKDRRMVARRNIVCIYGLLTAFLVFRRSKNVLVKLTVLQILLSQRLIVRKTRLSLVMN